MLGRCCFVVTARAAAGTKEHADPEKGRNARRKRRNGGEEYQCYKESLHGMEGRRRGREIAWRAHAGMKRG